MWDSNWGPPSTWPSSTIPFDQNGPIPPGRGPTTQWFKTCANSFGNFPVQSTPSPLEDPGKYCALCALCEPAVELNS